MTVFCTRLIICIEYLTRTTARQACVLLSFLLSKVPFYRESVVYIVFIHLIGNDHNFVFFDYKVSTQQHFVLKKSRVTEKTHILAEP